MATYLAGTTGAKWVDQVWNEEIDVLCYEEQVFANKIQVKGRTGSQMHFPKSDNLSRASLGDSTAGNNLTFVANTETEATLTPATTVVPVEVNLPLIARMAGDPSDMLKKSIEMSLAEGVDVNCLTLVSALTTNVVGNNTDNLTKGLILDADQKLSATAKQYYKAGSGGGICIVGVTQKDDILDISDITNAQIRGDSANPVVSGWVAKAFGISFYESGNVQISASTLYNVLFIPRAFAIAYNEKPSVKMEEYQLVKRIIGWVDFGYTTVRDQYAVQMKSIST